MLGHMVYSTSFFKNPQKYFSQFYFIITNKFSSLFCYHIRLRFSNIHFMNKTHLKLILLSNLKIQVALSFSWVQCTRKRRQGERGATDKQSPSCLRLPKSTRQRQSRRRSKDCWSVLRRKLLAKEKSH